VTDGKRAREGRALRGLGAVDGQGGRAQIARVFGGEFKGLRQGHGAGRRKIGRCEGRSKVSVRSIVRGRGLGAGLGRDGGQRKHGKDD
jgi:hypothetical protein